MCALLAHSQIKCDGFHRAYHVQNDHIWAINHQEANKKVGIKKKYQSPTNVMVWLGMCSAGLTKLIILDKGTLNHERYIREVLPIALKCGNEMMDSDSMFKNTVQATIDIRKPRSGAKTICLHFYSAPDDRQIHMI